MTRKKAIEIIRQEYLCVDRDCNIERSCSKCDLVMLNKYPILEAYKMAIEALEQEPCEDSMELLSYEDEKYITAEWLVRNGFEKREYDFLYCDDVEEISARLKDKEAGEWRVDIQFLDHGE